MTTIYKNRLFELCTYSNDSWSVVLTSGDDNYPGCRLTLTGFGRWLSIRLPNIIRPFRWKVQAEYWDEETIARIGRDWYWDYDERRYGVGVHCGNHFNIYYGRGSDDSRHEKRWSCFLPWSEWETVRWSGYGLEGEWLIDFSRNDVTKWSPQRDALPKSVFEFADFDGHIIRAVCHIEEREYHKGARYFRWLRWFFRPKICRSLDIAFSAEVGRRKGSWKGGTVGHSIDMLDMELHEAAFRRYCVQQGLRYIGPVSREDQS